MAWRAIQDNVDESESLAGLSHFGERLYWRLVAKADAWGRLPGSVGKVKARCVPLLSSSLEEIESALVEIEVAGRIWRYDVDGVWFIEIVGFILNQPRDATRATGESRYPPRDAATRGHLPQDAAFSSEQVKRESAAGCGKLPPKREKERETEKPLLADGSETTLPVEKELQTAALMELIGEHAEKNTQAVVSSLVARLPQGSLEKVKESVRGKNGQIDNRAAYVVRALQSEFAELAGRR